MVYIFLPIILSICFGWSKELSHWDGSFEYPQHMFWLRNKKKYIFCYALLTKVLHDLHIQCRSKWKHDKCSFQCHPDVEKIYGEILKGCAMVVRSSAEGCRCYAGISICKYRFSTFLRNNLETKSHSTPGGSHGGFITYTMHHHRKNLIKFNTQCLTTHRQSRIKET